MMIQTKIPQGVLWVCLDCAYAHEFPGEWPEPDHGGHHGPPWSQIDLPADRVTRGTTDCDLPGHWQFAPRAHEDDCETITFSHNTCDACGCGLAGTRYAYTWWGEG